MRFSCSKWQGGWYIWCTLCGTCINTIWQFFISSLKYVLFLIGCSISYWKCQWSLAERWERGDTLQPLLTWSSTRGFEQVPMQGCSGTGKMYSLKLSIIMIEGNLTCSGFSLLMITNVTSNAEKSCYQILRNVEMIFNSDGKELIFFYAAVQHLEKNVFSVSEGIRLLIIFGWRCCNNCVIKNIPELFEVAPWQYCDKLLY